MTGTVILAIYLAGVISTFVGSLIAMVALVKLSDWVAKREQRRQREAHR